MPLMAKKRMGRPPKEPGREVMFARVPGKLFQAFAQFLADYNRNNPRSEKAAHIEKAIEEYLAKRGFWPPKGEGEEP